MRTAIILALLVVAVSAAPEKRFLEAVETWFKNAGKSIAHTFNEAKKDFEVLLAVGKITGVDVKFNDAVKKMIPMIDSGMTEAACAAACVAGASTVLGPAAPLAGTVCAPVCKAALSQLEKAAG